MMVKLRSIFLCLFFSFVLSNVACSAQTTVTQKSEVIQNSTSPMSEPSAPVGWKKYQLGDTLTFNVILPAEPISGVSAIKDTEQTARTYISKTSSGVYGASYLNDLPLAASRSTVSGDEFFFDTFIKAFATDSQTSLGKDGTSINFKMLGQRGITIGNVEGLEQDFSVGKFLGRARLYRIEQGGLCFVAIWTETSPRVERTMFFDSVRIVGAPNPKSKL